MSFVFQNEITFGQFFLAYVYDLLFTHPKTIWFLESVSNQKLG